MIDRINDGVWSVMVTPFDSNGNIEYNALGGIIEFYINSGLSGIFSTCLTSEVANLSSEEIIELSHRTVVHTNGRVGVVAGGILFDSLDKQAELIKKVYQTGVDAVVVTASQLASQGCDDNAFKASVTKIMETTGDIPLGMYECPYPSHKTLSPDLYAWLAQTGRFVFHKDTSCDIREISQKISETRNSSLKFFNANCQTLLESLKIGGNGYCGVGTNYYPELYSWLFRNYADAEPSVVEKVFDFIKSSEKYFDICNAYPATAKAILNIRGLDIQTYCRIRTGNLNDIAIAQLKQFADNIERIKEDILSCSCTA